jgi:hypothetical protein
MIEEQTVSLDLKAPFLSLSHATYKYNPGNTSLSIDEAQKTRYHPTNRIQNNKDFRGWSSKRLFVS